LELDHLSALDKTKHDKVCSVTEPFRKVLKGFDALSVNILRLPWLANPSNRDAQSCKLWAPD